jgi:hypothetical protein
MANVTAQYKMALAAEKERQRAVKHNKELARNVFVALSDVWEYLDNNAVDKAPMPYDELFRIFENIDRKKAEEVIVNAL